MRVWNINTTQAGIITQAMGITTNRCDEDSKAINITLRPIDSRAKYSRSSYSYGFSTPRRGPWLCYHGFEEFIRQCFARGAARIKSTMGDWHSLGEFESALPELEYRNAGSVVFPIAMGADCPCDCYEGRE